MIRSFSCLRSIWPATAAALAFAVPAQALASSPASQPAPVTPAAPPLWGIGILPFVIVLLAIALLPLLARTRHWWEHNSNRLLVSLVLAAITCFYLFFAQGADATLHAVKHALLDEYTPFIILLFSLFVIAGGITLTGDLRATPITNSAILAIGAVIASFVGTTGASMLLIRPLLQTNSERRRVAHTVVFFIFLVSNVGGCLLPIGDPPLFLGYLRGVPFTWTLSLWKEWAFASFVLLVIYFIFDSIQYRRETSADIRHDIVDRKPLRLRGWGNLALLACVTLVTWQVVPGKSVLGSSFIVFPYLREILLLALVVLSLFITPRGARAANNFNYSAIAEVAVLFLGIFITMQVPIAVLNALGDHLPLKQPWHFYVLTGSLSSVLDNAPTYVVFFETANALTHAPGTGIIQLTSGHFIREDLLAAISLGAVFMGANTYIGNGPNFMVKSIAEQSGVRMPGFFGYFFFFALPILGPVLILVALLFL